MQSIRGFTYTGTFHGKKVIRLKADKLIVDKQKVGFLKFNLLNRVNFKNADIKLYAQPIQQDEAGHTGQNGSLNWTFKNTFTKESLPSLPVKRIAAIEFKPITVELYQGSHLLTRISARSAKIRGQKQAISFQGNVQIESGGCRLSTSRLLVVPTEEKVEIEGQYTLKTFEKETEGYGLTTDFFLDGCKTNGQG